MINKISLYFRCLLSFAVVSLVPIGCAVPPAAVVPVSEPPVYRSEVVDPEAKALFAYAQYRLLAGDNRWDEAIDALRRAVEFDSGSEYLRMGLAKALLHKNQPGESIAILREILQQAPEQIEAHELLGDLLGYQGQNEEAVGHYRQALVLDPENEMLRMRLAMALGRVGQNVEAIGLLEEMVARQPDAKLAHLSLARFYLEDQQPEKAKQTYRNLLEHHPDQQQAILEYGQVLEDQGLYAEAYALYREGIRQNPRAVAVRQQLALLYLHQNRKAEALEQLLAVRQLLPNNTQVLGRIGLLHLDMAAWTEAEADFRQLLQAGENAGRNRYYLGLALLGQQKFQDAIDIMAPIEESSPVFVDAVLQLAYVYRQSGQLEAAIEALEKVLDQGIQRPEVYYYLTSFYGDGGQLDKAAKLLAEGLSLYPGDIELLYQSAVLEERLGDRETALRLMKQILTVDPDHADALNFIAYHHAESGTELESALSQVQRALTAKRTGYIIDTLGWIYFKMGRFAESREQLEEATSLLPNDSVILEHLGDLYQALSLWQQAAEAYRKALELDPAAEGVREKLRELPLEPSE